MKKALYVLVFIACSCTPTAAPEDRALDAIRALMKDPESIKFVNVVNDKKSGVTCGEFNSKNAFGAYVGMRAFVFDGLETSLEGDREFDEHNAKCPSTGELAKRRQQAISDRSVRKFNEGLDDWVRKGEEAVGQ